MLIKFKNWSFLKRGHCLALQTGAGHDILPLVMIPPGRLVRISQIEAEPSVRHRLSELGLLPGTRLEIRQTVGQTLLIAVRGSRLALGRAAAAQIMVQILPSETS